LYSQDFLLSQGMNDKHIFNKKHPIKWMLSIMI